MILGVAVIVYNKYLHASNHLTSWHAVFGAGCTVWMVGQVGMGVGIAWYGKEMFGSEGEAKKWYKWHRYVVLSALMVDTTHSPWYPISLPSVHSHIVVITTFIRLP